MGDTTEEKAKPNFNYVEVVEKSTDIVIKRFDVSQMGERGIERFIRGLEINMNHQSFFTQTKPSETELELNPVA